MMIDINRLSHAVAVAREGNFSAAATAIPLSQSALTRSVQELERQYGIRIFERGRYGARLTQEGAEFIHMAEDVLQRNIADDEALRQIGHSVTQHVRFGIGGIAAASLLPHLLPELETLGLHYSVAFESNKVLRRLLQRGEIDFFVGGFPGESDEFATANEFETAKAAGGVLKLMVRHGHPLTSSQDGVPSMSSFPVASGTFIRDLNLESLFTRFALQSPVIEMDNYDLLARLAQTTDFVLIGSPILEIMRPDLGLVTLPDTEVRDFPIDWGVVWSGKTRLPEPARRIADTILTSMTEAIRGSGDS